MGGQNREQSREGKTEGGRAGEGDWKGRENLGLALLTQWPLDRCAEPFQAFSLWSRGREDSSISSPKSSKCWSCFHISVFRWVFPCWFRWVGHASSSTLLFGNERFYYSHSRAISGCDQLSFQQPASILCSECNMSEWVKDEMRLIISGKNFRL